MPGNLEGDKVFFTPEDVSPDEYNRALDGLRRFTEVDVSAIHDLNSLSAHASLVARDLRSVVLAAGQLDDEENRYRHLKDFKEREEYSQGASYVLERRIGERTIIAFAGEDNTTLLILNDPKLTSMDLSVVLPRHTDINTVDPDLGMYTVVAADWRVGMKLYVPIVNPNNPDQNQGFARTLQDGISTLLPTLPQSTILPPAFNY